ncbi:hypothetical protein GGX14DRAFT_388150 [Mycena pura]|uniref:Uncharacterized protein n=1 Tax=Mycena pura TaxID=153505 RepID=A0AAD6YKY6_9AGAR|nr:hypothetical protein GGX14DRAFT_388150 [Mycena pura]
MSFDTQLDLLRAFYQKSWGHSWSTREVVADIPTDDSDDATASDSDEAMTIDLADDVSHGTTVDSSHTTFTVYDEMLEVALALGMASMVQDVLVVREEYKYLHATRRNGVRTYVRIEGHPGTGPQNHVPPVSSFLRRLEEKSPTAVQISKESYYIFDEQGVACRDARQHLSGPEPTRWRGWLKQRMGDPIVSELPTALEIAVIARELGLDATLAGRLVRKWGPSTKDIIDLLQSGEDVEARLQDTAEAAARAVLRSPERLRDVLSDRSAPSLSITGSAVVFLRPSQDDGRRWLSVAQPFIPTEYLAGIVGAQGSQLANADFLKVFDALNSTYSFAKNMHGRLCGGGAAIIIDKFTDLVETIGETMNMTPATKLLPGTLDALASASSDAFYWLPSVSKFPGIDGILGDRNGNVFAVQAIFNADPVIISPEEGLKKAWKNMAGDVRESRSWHFVAVADKPATAKKLGRTMATQLKTLTLGLRKTKVDVWSCSL